jgi:multiple sugar transport system ATP-binding protein
VRVRLQQVEKSFGATRVLYPIDLVFEDRQFVTLLGPSGCGKTTLLRMIAGLEKLSGGSIWFGKRRVDDLAPRDRNVAMVFQSYALYPHMSVERNIGYGLRVRGVKPPQVRKRVGPVAKVLEITHLLSRKPRQLSGGQRQRVALGRAMVRKPDVFLMDEPLSNLDAKLRVTMRAELKRFHMDLETTTVYVTHDQLEAMTMSDKIAVMNDGVVQQFGSPEEIYNWPANLFVAGFIGSPPMNFVQGTLGRDGGLHLTVQRQRVTLPDAYLPALGGMVQESPLVLGIRPQDIDLVPADSPGAVSGRVWLVELLGSEKLVDVEIGAKQRFTAQVRADTRVAIDDAVGLRLDLAKIQLFEPQGGAVLPRAH